MRQFSPTQNARRRWLRSLTNIEPLEKRYAMAVFTVTNTNDSGAGSLRSAILQANELAGADRIEFNITSPSKTIALETPLPFLEDTTELDASTQPGTIDRPIVELDGSAITSASAAGLVIQSNNSLVRGLTINNFAQGIVIQFSSGATLQGNHIGIDSAGGTAIGNRQNGVYIIDSAFSLIGGSTSQDRNVISGNGEHGVRISGSSMGNSIQGNYIGTNAVGLAAIPNARDGILVGNGALQTLIGTDRDGKDDATEGNIISGNLLSGVNLSGTQGNTVAGNRIGIGAGANAPLGNGGDGVLIAFDSSSNSIGTNADGTSDALEANVIASNKGNGIRINNSRANQVAGNFIGLLDDGVTPSPNLFSGVLIDGGSLGNLIGRSAGNDSRLSGNVISANVLYGIWISDASLNTVLSNMIGRTADDQGMLTNGLGGVRLTNASGNEVGLTPGLFNSIGYQTVAIRVDGDSQRNALNYNSYTGASGDPIDLDGDGPTANDANDTDTGPNSLQNFPLIQLVTTQGVIAGTINSRPYKVYQIQLYTSGWPTMVSTSNIKC